MQRKFVAGAALVAAALLSSCGGGRSASDPAVVPDDLNVTMQGPETVAAGSTATYSVVVVNSSRGAANNITITETLPSGLSATVTCTASTGADCPTTLGATMTLPTLAAGRFITLVYQVAIPSTQRGSFVHQVAVTSDDDSDSSDNAAAITTLAQDARTGAYKAYAADGKVYDLAIDFDALSYTMTGGTTPSTKTFVAVGGEYVVSGNQRLRTATDLVVGNHDFAGNNVPLPYVAARNFATTIQEAAFNLGTRTVAADGTVSTHPGTARIAGNTLQICQTDSGVQSTQDCPVVADSWLLTISNGVVTGTSTTGGDPIIFQVARSGGTVAMLTVSPAADGSAQLRVGLQEGSGLTWGTVYGPTGNGDWVKIVLDAATTSYAVLGSATNDQAGLQRISNAGPFAMMFGTRLSDSADIYVMQANPLVLVVGAYGDRSNGTFQVAVP